MSHIRVIEQMMKHWIHDPTFHRWRSWRKTGAVLFWSTPTLKRFWCRKAPHIPPLKPRKKHLLNFFTFSWNSQSPNHKIPRDTMEFCDRKFKGLGFALTSSVAWLSGIRSTPQKNHPQSPKPRENEWLEHENTPLEKEKHRPKPPIFGFHVCFRGCNQWQLQTEQISHLLDARLSIFSS